MKRTPLRRYTPLKGRSRHQHRGASPKTKRLHQTEARLRAAHDIVRARSGGRCEIAWEGCATTAVHVHHRRPRGMGGSSDPATNAPSNLLHACLNCHTAAEAQRARAIGNGIVLHRGATPSEEPVIYRGWPVVLLADDGTCQRVEKP